jgi:nucleoside-diphosphate-sugar epimerase
MMLDIKTVMVTGAGGKLGSVMCEALVADGYHVIGVDRRVPIGVAGVEDVQLDIADYEAIEAQIARSDAVIHLASCKEDRDAVINVSAKGTFNILDASMRTKKPKRVVLASGDAVNGIYFNRQPVPIREDMPMVAYPGYYPLSKAVEETMFKEYFWQAGLPTVCMRMSWIQSEDDILTHLTVAGESFGVPVWSELMNDRQRAAFAGGKDAAVALRHPDGRPMRRHVVAVEDCVQAFLLSLKTEGIEGETFMIGMTDPFDYVEAAAHAAQQLGIDTLDLVDPVGQDFCVDTTKARYVLGYKPKHDIFSLIDSAVAFRRAGSPRRQRSGFKG